MYHLSLRRVVRHRSSHLFVDFKDRNFRTFINRGNVASRVFACKFKIIGQYLILLFVVTYCVVIFRTHVAFHFVFIFFKNGL